MKRRILSVTAVFFVIITIMTAVFISKVNENSNKNMYRRQLVELNEIKMISENIADESNAEAISELTEAVGRYENQLQDEIRNDESSASKKYAMNIYISCIIFLAVVFSYVYFAILRPFDKMRDFADEIAKGNFNIPLKYERSNYFGAFTWAFDNMRKEIITARDNEKTAVLNNKTVIATISHDIKTPIASIRAYCEGLAANLDGNIEKRERYISVITKKCDEVVNLTNDLFLHSVSDLDKLKIELKPENVKQLLANAINDSDSSRCTVRLSEDIPDCTVMLDKQRFEQVINNLIGNSMKYAGTDIDVSGVIVDNDYVITVRDYGDGIPDDNMPFIFGKFYRGANAEGKQGSGLGLYITKYIMDKHNGSVKLFNHCDGLEAVLSFPISTE